MSTARTLLAAIVAVLTAVGLITPASAFSAGPALVLLGADTLTVTAKQHNSTATAFISIFNRGTETATITMSFAASSAAGVAVAKTPHPNAIGPGDAQRVQVTFTGVDGLTSTTQGELIVHGGPIPIAKTVSITPAPQPDHLWARDFIFGSLILAALAFLATALWAAIACPKMLRRPAPGPKWDFGSSWATNLTALGATLGTVLGAATLPAVPSQIDKETLVRLNLGFGLIVVVAPFLYHAIRIPTREKAMDDDGLYGWNFTLLAACCLTFAAVIGELATLTLLFWELLGGRGYSELALAAAGVTGLLVVWYYVATVPFFATTDWAAPAVEPAVSHHLRWLKAAENWLRERRELAGATPEEIEATPNADEVGEAMRATAPTHLPPTAIPTRWRLP